MLSWMDYLALMAEKERAKREGQYPLLVAFVERFQAEVVAHYGREPSEDEVKDYLLKH